VFAAIGIPSSRAAKVEDDWWPVLDGLAQSPRVVAVGKPGSTTSTTIRRATKQAEVFHDSWAQSLGTPGLSSVSRARCT